MYLLPDTSRRVREDEVMDGDDLESHLHGAALRGLERINRVSGTERIIWRPIWNLARDSCASSPGGSLSLLDVATGAGDVPIGLSRRFRRHGLSCHVHACDRSPVAVDHARRRAEQRAANVHVFRFDVVRDKLLREYDIVTCCLFLHHLDNEQALVFMRNMAAATRRMLIINDLERGPMGWLAARVGTRVLTRSKVVHTDGPRSVRAAFTGIEAQQLAEQAGLRGCRLARHWPHRFVLTWIRPWHR